jgi:hypothetical protein
MKEFENSVLGRNGADGRRLRRIFIEFKQKYSEVSWNADSDETVYIKIMPAEENGVVYIYQRDVRITWDSFKKTVVNIDEMSNYDLEVPFHMPDDEWNRYCGLCVLGALIVNDKTIEDFADRIHCSKPRALNLIHGTADICSYEAVAITSWFGLAFDELFGR